MGEKEACAIMNEDILKGKWKEFVGEMKTQWGKLTDDDLTYAEGSSDKLVGKLQERYGWAKDDASRSLSEFLDARKPRV